MRLKIEIEIPDDRKYRYLKRAYDISVQELAEDIAAGLRITLNAMQEIDLTEATGKIRQHSVTVGSVNITLE